MHDRLPEPGHGRKVWVHVPAKYCIYIVYIYIAPLHQFEQDCAALGRRCIGDKDGVQQVVVTAQPVDNRGVSIKQCTINNSSVESVTE